MSNDQGADSTYLKGRDVKSCNRCKRSLLPEGFNNDRTRSDGKFPWCKECHRAQVRRSNLDNPIRAAEVSRRSTLKYQYGMSIEEYDALLASQDGVCAICGSLPVKKRLAVDHDHTTNDVRGLLCTRCNTTLGRMKDDPALLRRAADYVEGLDVNSLFVQQGKEGIMRLLSGEGNA